ADKTPAQPNRYDRHDSNRFYSEPGNVLPLSLIPVRMGVDRPSAMEFGYQYFASLRHSYISPRGDGFGCGHTREQTTALLASSGKQQPGTTECDQRATHGSTSHNK